MKTTTETTTTTGTGTTDLRSGVGAPQLPRPPDSDEGRKRRHDELVRNFRKGTEELVEVVADAIRTKPADAPPAAPAEGQT